MSAFDEEDQTDLTSIIVIARRGLRRDVKILCDALPKGKLSIPLALTIAATPDGKVLTWRDKICAHIISHPKEKNKVYTVLFTKDEIIKPHIEALKWKTSDGPLQILELSAKDALEYCLQLIDEKQAVGLIINPFHESALELTPSELRSLVKGEPVPLVHHLRDLPIQEGEKIDMCEPSTPPPIELIGTIKKYINSHPDIRDYKIFQMFNADRDIEPHLALKLSLEGKSSNHQEIVHEITLAIEGKVPSPGYIDIMFND